MTARVQPGGFGFVRRSPTELVVVPTLDSWEARQLPAAAVDRLRPPRSRYLVGALLGLVLAAAGAAAAAGLVPVVPPGAVRIAGVVLWAVAALVLYTRGHPVGHVIGGVGGAVGGLRGGGPVSGAVAVAGGPPCLPRVERGTTPGQEETRCNPVVRDVDEFHAAFDVQPGDGLHGLIRGRGTRLSRARPRSQPKVDAGPRLRRGRGPAIR